MRHANTSMHQHRPKNVVLDVKIGSCWKRRRDSLIQFVDNVDQFNHYSFRDLRLSVDPRLQCVFRDVDACRQLRLPQPVHTVLQEPLPQYLRDACQREAHGWFVYASEHARGIPALLDGIVTSIAPYGVARFTFRSRWRRSFHGRVSSTSESSESSVPRKPASESVTKKSTSRRNTSPGIGIRGSLQSAINSGVTFSLRASRSGPPAICMARSSARLWMAIGTHASSPIRPCTPARGHVNTESDGAAPVTLRGGAKKCSSFQRVESEPCGSGSGKQSPEPHRGRRSGSRRTLAPPVPSGASIAAGDFHRAVLLLFGGRGLRFALHAELCQRRVVQHAAGGQQS